MFVADLLEDTSNVVAILPGRFHPFHKGHAYMYETLVSRYGRDRVWIATSNKVDPPKSPFSFSDKLQMMQLAGIPADRVVETKNPYKVDELTNSMDPTSTIIIFAVSDKDMDEDPRFSFKPLKDGSASYLQRLPDDLKQAETMDAHGYITSIPTLDFKVLGEPMRSATAIRAIYAQADDEKRVALIKDLFGGFNNEVKAIMDAKLQINEKVGDTWNVGDKFLVNPDDPSNKKLTVDKIKGNKLLGSDTKWYSKYGVTKYVMNEDSNHAFIMGFIDKWTENGQPDDYMDDLVAYVKKTIPDSKNWNYAASLIQQGVQSYQEREYGASSLMGLRGHKESKEITNEDVKHLTELAFLPLLIPAVAAAVRLGAPHVLRYMGKKSAKELIKKGATGAAGAAKPLIKKGAGAALKGTGSIAKGVGKAALKHPVKATLLGVGAKVYTEIDELIDAITELVGDLLDSATIKALAQVAIKWALPAAAVVAILYGGKKLYDYMSDEPEAQTEGGFASVSNPQADMYRLTAKAMQATPGSKNQKDKIKKLNVLRAKQGLKAIPEQAIIEVAESMGWKKGLAAAAVAVGTATAPLPAHADPNILSAITKLTRAFGSVQRVTPGSIRGDVSSEIKNQARRGDASSQNLTIQGRRKGNSPFAPHLQFKGDIQDQPSNEAVFTPDDTLVSDIFVKLQDLARAVPGKTMGMFKKAKHKEDVIKFGDGDMKVDSFKARAVLDAYKKIKPGNEAGMLAMMGSRKGFQKIIDYLTKEGKIGEDINLIVARHRLDEFGVGIITKQNSTPDVKPGETQRQAAKFGNKLNKKGLPPLVNEQAKVIRVVGEELHKLNKEDPIRKSEVAVRGVGVYTIETLHKNLAEKFLDLAEKMQSMSPEQAEQANYLLQNSALPVMLEGLMDAYAELREKRRKGGVGSRGIDL